VPFRVTVPEIEWVVAASAGRVTVPTSNEAIAIICASFLNILNLLKLIEWFTVFFFLSIQFFYFTVIQLSIYR
jgi:hypothetical protein